MKKFFICILFTLLGFLIAVVFFFPISGVHIIDRIFSGDSASSNISSDEYSSSQLSQLAFETAEYIKHGDYISLSKIVHPEYGLVISPYATISLSSNKCFTREQVAHFGDDSEVYIWGISDGAEEPIEMTPGKYFSEYVYDCDYLNAPIVGINRIVKSGNSLENLSDMFPDAQFVDLHNPGTQEADYKDWCTLRLVFEEYDNTMMLTAIIHSESTL